MYYKPLLLLAFLAVFIWIRDLSWTKEAEDTLPILAAFPLFFWLGSPWKLNEESSPLSWKEVFLAGFFFLVGIAFDATFLLAVGWTYLLWSFLKRHLPKESLSSYKRLLILPLFAFPWIALDANQIGWWFRLSSAFTCSKIFLLLGFSVEQEGTNLLINHLPVSIEAACAGLNTLQSTLIAGIAANFLIVNNSLFWWNLPLLILISWMANMIRIVTLVILALATSPEVATSAFHMIGGVLIVGLAFSLALILFYFQTRKTA